MSITRVRRAARGVVGLVLATGALCVACRAGGVPARLPIAGGRGPGALGTVVHVVDGDTLDVRVGAQVERVRLLGIDTPETVKPGTPVQCYGPEASNRTKQLLVPGTAVLLQRDREARDRYARLLVYLWRRRDGLFVNRSLLAGGFARPLSISPNTAHRAELAAVSAAADRADRGLWGTCPPGEPP